MSETLKEWYLKRIESTRGWSVPQFATLSLILTAQDAANAAIWELVHHGEGLTMSEHQAVVAELERINPMRQFERRRNGILEVE